MRPSLPRRGEQGHEAARRYWSSLPSPRIYVGRFGAGKGQADALPSLFAAADAFVFPTLGDRSGWCTGGDGCGLPVISTSAAGGLHDRVVDCVNGFVVAPPTAWRFSLQCADWWTMPGCAGAWAKRRDGASQNRRLTFGPSLSEHAATTILSRRRERGVRGRTRNP
jgi:hypothetical protein